MSVASKRIGRFFLSKIFPHQKGGRFLASRRRQNITMAEELAAPVSVRQRSTKATLSMPEGYSSIGDSTTIKVRALIDDKWRRQIRSLMKW